MNCDNCNAPNITPVPNGTGETLCARCAQAALAHGHFNARVEVRPGDTLTRGDALDVIDEVMADEGMDGMCRLAVEWIGHCEDDHECADAESYAEFLREYIAECCLTDDVRSNGPKDSDDTGISA